MIDPSPPQPLEAMDRIKYEMAYNIIGPIIENCIRANKGEDGLILVDYAELRDALAEALVSPALTQEDAEIVAMEAGIMALEAVKYSSPEEISARIADKRTRLTELRNRNTDPRLGKPVLVHKDGTKSYLTKKALAQLSPIQPKEQRHD